MSDLRPKGVHVTIGGEEFELLFTIGAIEDIQEATGLGLFDVMQKIASAVDGNTSKETLKCYKAVLHVMTGKDEEFFRKIPWGEYAPLAKKMLEAFGISLPDPDEDEDDDDEEKDPKTKAGA